MNFLSRFFDNTSPIYFVQFHDDCNVVKLIGKGMEKLERLCFIVSVSIKML